MTKSRRRLTDKKLAILKIIRENPGLTLAAIVKLSGSNPSSKVSVIVDELKSRGLIHSSSVNRGCKWYAVEDVKLDN